MLNEISKKLIDKNLTLSTAESCTGGLLSSAFTDISGSSAFIRLNVVTYANEAKHKILGVKNETLERYGAVSEQTAFEMAFGLYKLTLSDICISTTGVAGPTSDGINPVGRVCFGFYINGITYTRKVEFGDIGRNEVRNKSVEYLFKELYKLL